MPPQAYLLAEVPNAVTITQTNIQGGIVTFSCPEHVLGPHSAAKYENDSRQAEGFGDRLC